MRVISKPALSGYWTRNEASKKALAHWYDVAIDATWTNFADVKKDFPAADLKGDRLIFDIKGNTYRLVTGVNFKRQILFIKFIGTHADYDKIDVETVELD